MIDQEAEILFNAEVAADFFLSRLSIPKVAFTVQPGQFVEIAVADAAFPLLRVPLSVGLADVERGTIDVLYEVLGPKTEVFCKLDEGEGVACLGPLGRGFEQPASRRDAILVGGGIGVPPLLFLGHNLRSSEIDVRLLVGALSSDKLLPREILSPAAQRLSYATDDGSYGHHGFVTDLLREAIEESEECVVYACGPHLMMKAVASVCAETNTPCQVSLEEYMACGIGICVGCVVERARTDGLSPYETYSRICVDGPVYDAKEIRW